MNQNSTQPGTAEGAGRHTAEVRELIGAARQAMDRLLLPEHEYDRKHEGNVIMRLGAAIAKAEGTQP